jgi:uncharacterized membrane protein
MIAPIPSQRLETLLATLLSRGTWLASAVVALGLALPGTRLVTAGIALFIFLPIARVAVMLVAFIAEREYRLGAVAAFVLLTILAGFALGMHSGGFAQLQ